MAASMLRQRWSTVGNFYQKICLRNAYIVLLPEIPDDTANTNPILQLDANPAFKSITTENCVNAVGKLVIDYECKLAKLTENMKVADSNVQPIQKSFADVFEPLEALSLPLDHVWSLVKVLYLVRHSEEMARVYKNLHSRVQKARVQRFLSLPIYHNIRELNADKKHLTEAQQRVVNKYLLESRLKGIELSASQQEHFSDILGKLANEKDSLRKKVNEATNRFVHIIDNREVVKSFPDSLLRKMAVDSFNPTRGPWKITLHPEVYNDFLKYCPDQNLRWNAWLANVTKASSHTDSGLNTSIHIEEIRYQRNDEAKLLGFDSYAQMSMETKMAGSVKNVMSMIATLHKWSKVAMQQQLTQLQEFAVTKGFEGRMSLWDIDYWRNQHKQETFGVDENDLRFYFPMPKVLDGLFQMCHKLFGITIKEATNEVETWDDHVTYYKVFNSHDKFFLGSFYLDPYLRPNNKLTTKAWIECSANVSGNPVAYLILNVFPPLLGRPALMTLEDVISLFQKFGHCLQHVLTTVKYNEVAGLTNIEWDAVEICPLVMSNLLFNKSVLELVSGHHETGKSLSPSLIQNIQGGRVHMKSFDINTNLYLSSLDLKLYSSRDYWLDIVRSVWSQYIPFPLDKRNSHLCSFTTIFCDEYPAAHYSFLWAEMIAADIYSAFLEAPSNGETLEQVGLRFRDTFLSLGGGCHPNEVFRRFRGRDPSPDAILKLYNLKH